MSIYGSQFPLRKLLTGAEEREEINLWAPFILTYKQLLCSEGFTAQAYPKPQLKEVQNRIAGQVAIDTGLHMVAFRSRLGR